MGYNHIRKKKNKRKQPITDHAIVQFLHRTKVLNIKELRKTLYTKGLQNAIKYSKQTEDIVRHNENGLQFIVRQGRVITILTYDDIRLKNGDIAKTEDSIIYY